jgi:hypothetical protein
LAWGVPAPGNQWCDLPQCVEHRTTNEVLSLVFSLLFFLPNFLSLSSGARMMTGRRRLVMREDIRVRKGHRSFSWPTVSQPRWRGNGTLHNALKCAVYAYMPQLLVYRALHSAGYNNNIQNGSHDCRGPAKAQGSKAKPTSQVSVT